MHGKTLDLVRVVAVASEEGEERASCGGRRWGWCLRLNNFKLRCGLNRKGDRQNEG